MTHREVSPTTGNAGHTTGEAVDTILEAGDTTGEEAGTTLDAGRGAEPTRRTVLASAALAGVGAAALAACGSGQQAGDAVGSASDAAKGAVKDAISKASIPVGGGRIFADQKVVVTQPTAGDFKAFSAVCTHQACLVTTVSEGTINCACHGSRFDITTGAVRTGPATSPLPEKSVSIGSDGIKVT